MFRNSVGQGVCGERLIAYVALIAQGFGLLRCHRSLNVESVKQIQVFLGKMYLDRKKPPSETYNSQLKE